MNARRRHRARPGALLPVLHAEQEAFSHIPPRLGPAAQCDETQLHARLTTEKFDRLLTALCRAP